MPDTPQRPWVWFDLDDTLWDFTTNSHHTLAEVYTKAGLECWWPDVDSWRDAYHAVNSELWTLYAPGHIDRDTLRTERFARPLRQAGCAPSVAEVMSRRLDVMYLDLLGQRSLTVPGAEALLKALAPYYNIGVLSNGFAGVQHAKLASSGLDRYVDLIVLSDAIDVNKPDVRIFRYAEQQAHTRAATCTLVGDNPDTDIAGALNAGWQAVWYNPGGIDTPADIAANPHLTVVGSLDIEPIMAALKPANEKNMGK